MSEILIGFVSLAIFAVGLGCLLVTRENITPEDEDR